MSQPTPVLRRGRWTLDLRWADLGQYTLQTPGSNELAVQATQEAFAVFFRERDARELRSKQGSVFSGPTVRKVARDWSEEREHETSGGARYVAEYLAGVVKRFGDRAIRQFEPPAGSQVLKGWRDEMAKKGAPEFRSPKTRRNYLNILLQLCRYAADRGLIAAVPVKPKATIIDETMTSADWPWYTEADFRALRDGLYVGAEGDLRAWLRRWRPGVSVDDYIARRRLYCSFGFYTGMHVYDLDRLDDGQFAADIGTYARSNHKSARSVPVQWFEAPGQLWEDVQLELARLGRHWNHGELICGGAWPRGAIVLTDTAKRLGLPTPVNFRSVFRRSTVHEYCIRGWPLERVAKIVGHVDTRMIETVYRRVVDRMRSLEQVPWDRESTARVLQGRLFTSRAKVSQLRPVPLAPDVQKDRG
jgi:integrase